MTTKRKSPTRWSDRKIGRRSFLKKGAAGAGIAVAAMYVAPSLMSTGPKTAYASITPAVGDVSIEIRPDDITVSAPGAGPHPITAQLCNTSGWQPTSISSWEFTSTVLLGGACLDSVDLPNPATFSSLAQVCGACEPGVDPEAVCDPFTVVLNTNEGWTDGDCEEIKVRVVAKANGGGRETLLTVSITQ